MKLRISSNGRHLETANGRPFFWLADTAWNAALRGDAAEWERYLDTRAEQGFTVIQFVASPWRGCMSPRHGRIFEEVGGVVTFDEAAFEKMEEWIDLIADRGLVPAPVMIWDNNPQDRFFDWSEETCIEAGRLMIERWSRFEPVWILGGDGDYRSSEQLERWKRIGAAVFSGLDDVVATMHPCGATWVGDIFAQEPWYSFVGIQSGHGSVHYDLNFLLSGPYTRRWHEIRKPFINLEPNYEMAQSYVEGIRFTDYHVRRAAYWSLFSAPTAGITYGNNNIWVWAQADGEQAEGHGESWVAGTWTDGLETPGIEHLGSMRAILDDIGWVDLEPAPHLLARQPGWADPNEFISVAQKPGGWLVIAYLPVGGEVWFDGTVPIPDMEASWIDPRTGDVAECPIPEQGKFTAPDQNDWLLMLRER